jgi:hypothetical protein
MKHLSPEQISSVVAGIRIPEDAHISECAECIREVERARNVFTLFRSSVREWTDTLDHSAFPVQSALDLQVRRYRGTHRTRMAWVFATAALAAAVAIPMYQDSRAQEAKAQAEKDSQLLDDVNAQLSRSGPLAMDPLMQLMPVPIGSTGPDFLKANSSEPGTKQEDGGIQ